MLEWQPLKLEQNKESESVVGSIGYNPASDSNQELGTVFDTVWLQGMLVEHPGNHLVVGILVQLDNRAVRRESAASCTRVVVNWVAVVVVEVAVAVVGKVGSAQEYSFEVLVVDQLPWAEVGLEPVTGLQSWPPATDLVVLKAFQVQVAAWAEVDPIGYHQEHCLEYSAWMVTDPNWTVQMVCFVVGSTNYRLKAGHSDMVDVVVDHLAYCSHPFVTAVVPGSKVVVVVVVGEVAVDCLSENPMDLIGCY